MSRLPAKEPKTIRRQIETLTTSLHALEAEHGVKKGLHSTKELQQYQSMMSPEEVNLINQGNQSPRSSLE